ncbi:MAG: formylglycine-generating enzyme family protein, partial [Planctomycetota bacterium]|nr:formylglycine-generating enzyme family protein [Planctomycetota bacterium]
MRSRQAQLAHGDLQHGNVLLVPVPGTEKLSLKLVDYDGMFVPTLTGHQTGEVGHPNYQHPQRLREGIFSAEIDRFSHLAIYTAIRSLIVGGGKLWLKSDNGENLLFREADYQNPGESATFRHLWELGDAQVRALTWRLLLAAEDRLEHVPLLEQIVTEGQVQTLTPSQLRHAEQFLFPSHRSTPAPSPRTEAKPAEPSPPPATPPRATAKPAEPPLDAKPKSSKPAETFQVSANSVGMKFVLLPPGEFLMGSPDSDGDAGYDEKPQHRVRITKPFYLGVYEVTQAQYQKVVGSNPSVVKGEFLPVETVSWDDAAAFCKRLSEVPAERAAGRAYRLPTEAEWEYACRAGSTSKFSFGDSETELGKHAWYDKNSGSKTHPVGEKQANVWGLYDMHGNVREWCQDWYGPYEAKPASDPSGPSSASFRVVRGGGWSDGGGSCRSASRFRNFQGFRFRNFGFRVAVVRSGSWAEPGR